MIDETIEAVPLEQPRSGTALGSALPTVAEEITQHSLPQTVGLHLLPGVVIVAMYALITPCVRAAGFPSLFGLSLAILLGLVPFELGLLLYLGKRRNGRWSLAGIVMNCEKTGLWPAIFLVVGLVIWFELSSLILGKFVDQSLMAQFKWLPGWFFYVESWSTYPKSIQFYNWLAALLFTGLLGPWIEELYFRGYLLPRISWMGGWAPIFNAFFFSLYHFMSPWQLVSRFIGVIPLVYVAYTKRNIRIGMFAHWILNTVGLLSLLLAVFR